MSATNLNNTNDASHRTAAQVKSLLKSYGLVDGSTVENMGDSNQFCVYPSTLKNLVAAKKAGFIRVDVSKNTFTIKCH